MSADFPCRTSYMVAMEVVIEKSQEYPNLTLSWFVPEDSQKMVQKGHRNLVLVV